mmetsp:Transcript_176674/g.566550  ORF Transcript_176674/g.566550 Transcript_176674/m.566550 type:complete len:358 (+) Transcript_176674:97-1170(+)
MVVAVRILMTTARGLLGRHRVLRGVFCGQALVPVHLPALPQAAVVPEVLQTRPEQVHGEGAACQHEAGHDGDDGDPLGVGFDGQRRGIGLLNLRNGRTERRPRRGIHVPRGNGGGRVQAAEPAAPEEREVRAIWRARTCRLTCRQVVRGRLGAAHGGFVLGPYEEALRGGHGQHIGHDAQVQKRPGRPTRRAAILLLDCLKRRHYGPAHCLAAEPIPDLGQRVACREVDEGKGQEPVGARVRKGNAAGAAEVVAHGGGRHVHEPRQASGECRGQLLLQARVEVLGIDPQQLEPHLRDAERRPRDAVLEGGERGGAIEELATAARAPKAEAHAAREARATRLTRASGGLDRGLLGQGS